MSLYYARSLQCLEELAGLQCVLVRAESRKAEVACSVLTESFARRAYDAEAVKDHVEELPAAHVVRTLEPDVRRVHAACEVDALPGKYLSKCSCVALVISDVCLAVFQTLAGE